MRSEMSPRRVSYFRMTLLLIPLLAVGTLACNAVRVLTGWPLADLEVAIVAPIVILFVLVLTSKWHVLQVPSARTEPRPPK